MKTCEAREKIYSKIFSALDASYPARKETAEIMTHYAVQNRVDPSLDAWGIISKSREISAINGIKAQAAKQVPQSKEEGSSGVPDKQYDVSHYQTEKECRIGLVNAGASLAIATEQCARQFVTGRPQNMVSAKTRKAVLSNLAKQYPNLSKESRENIVSEVIKEASQKKIYQASVENETVEVPYFVTVSDMTQATSLTPFQKKVVI
jgi:hypothetical protein